MDGKRFKSAAVVLGMHRSGTSAIAGVLALAGFSAPKTLLPTSAANERGFWESEPVKALNDELFAEVGTSWHGLDAISFERIPKQTTRSANQRAKATLEAEFEPGSRPLIKDPRLCRLWPLWRPAIADLVDRAAYAITVRSPLEVAPSLAQRNDFDADLSFLLWARHYLDAEYHTRGLPRVWVTYDSLIADWRRSLHLLENQFDKFQLDLGVEKKIDDFLSGHLRHHRTADEQALVELERLPIVQDTYHILLEATREGDVGVSRFKLLDTLRERFDDQSDTLSRVLENARLDRKRLASARAQGEAAGAELAQARKALADLNVLRSALETQAAAQSRLELRIDSAIGSLAEAIQQRSLLERKLSDALSSADDERAAAQEKRESLEKKLASITIERDAVRNKVGRLRADAESLERRLAAAASERDTIRVGFEKFQVDANKNAEEFQAALDELRSDHELVQTELKDVKRKYRSTQFQLGRDREKLRKTQDQLAFVEHELETLRHSRVWRFYTAVGGSVRRCTGTGRRVVGGKDRKRKAEVAGLLHQSPLFDRKWYLSRYPDVAAAGIDPVTHYLENGWREGRDPSPNFSTAAYLRANNDVARAGLNPLLHYLEFGYSEGRHIGELSRSPLPSALSTEQELAPAAACASFPVAAQSTVRWRRAAQLNVSQSDVAEIGGQAIGRAGEACPLSMIEAAFQGLATLSGYSSAPWSADSFSALQPLIDVWHVTFGRLRSRWQTDGRATVIRAYQHDPAREGALTLIAEGMITSEIDFVDIDLVNAYFPTLFVICEPDGAVRTVKMFAFPSLSRGGLHYPELVALRSNVGDEPFDVMRTADTLAGRLSCALLGAGRSFVAKILIDLTGADGSEPLFEEGFRVWLSRVMRVGIEPVGAATGTATDAYLTDAARLNVPSRKEGRTVTFPADTVPSISILTMPAGAGYAADEQPILPLLIAVDDPAQPSTLVSMPPFNAETSIVTGSDHPPALPTLGDGEVKPAERLAVAAIRHVRQPLPNDSELLLPVAPPALTVPQESRAITWLVFPEDWNEDALTPSLEALALQRSSKPFSIFLVGDVAPTTASLAQGVFGRRASFWPDVTAALDGVQTPVIGYLGAHVVLHDPRTYEVLSALLENADVVSASCVLIATEKQGKGWQVSVTDPGTFAGADGNDEPEPRHCKEAGLFWRATYPVLRPPRDLWIARANTARGWLQRAGPMRPEEGLQVCTSIVTASYVAGRLPTSAHLRPPASAELQAIRSEALVG